MALLPFRKQTAPAPPLPATLPAPRLAAATAHVSASVMIDHPSGQGTRFAALKTYCDVGVAAVGGGVLGAGVGAVGADVGADGDGVAGGSTTSRTHSRVSMGSVSSGPIGIIDTASTDTVPYVDGSTSVPNPRWWIVTEPCSSKLYSPTGSNPAWQLSSGLVSRQSDAVTRWLTSTVVAPSWWTISVGTSLWRLLFLA